VANEARRRLGLAAIPYKLLWNTTHYCNSRCQTCNIWQIYPAAGSQKDELHGAEVAEIISSLGKNLLWLTMTGGEPTLKLQVAETVNEVYDRCPNLAFITLNTNAILPEPTLKVMEAIAGHCRRAEVLAVLSLDGVGEVHDRVRGVSGNFAAVVETRRRLLELRQRLPNLGLCVQSTVSRHNLPDLAELLDFCRGNGDEHLLTFAQEAELYRNYGSGQDVEREALPAVVREAARRYRPRRPRDLVQWAHLRLLQGYVEDRRSPVPCTAGSSTLTLGPKGDVSGCLFLDTPMGNAADFGRDLTKLLASERARAVQKASSRCSHCWTNCESFTSMMSSPVRTLARAVTARPHAPSAR
jgi:MoaA/NifB/PqqE/SkfB family radical SAM enzyme